MMDVLAIPRIPGIPRISGIYRISGISHISHVCRGRQRRRASRGYGEPLRQHAAPQDVMHRPLRRLPPVFKSYGGVKTIGGDGVTTI